MDSERNIRMNYLVAAVFGAIIGGGVVAVMGNIIPRMMSQMMQGMMANMMAGMGGEGCDPEAF